MNSSVPLATLEDVCNYLGAAQQTNESLSRRVYKDTDCGAWAKVEERTRFETRKETWRVSYARIEGVWQMLAAFREGQPVEFSAMAPNVREFYWPSGVDMQATLDELVPGQSHHEHTEQFDAMYPVGSELVFRVGAIVEGSDAEVAPEEVVLPATGEQIDNAIEIVESAASDLWNEANP